MTLKLASDNTNVEQFPGTNLRDTAAAARKYAELVDRGEFGDVIRATLIVETRSGQETQFWGEIPSINEAIGNLEIAKQTLIMQIIEGDLDE
jgi:hypothetical protein